MDCPCVRVWWTTKKENHAPMSIGRMFRVSCLLGYRRVARAEEKDKKKCNQRLNEVEIVRDTGNTAGHASVRTMFPYSHYFARLGRGVKSSSRYTSRCLSSRRAPEMAECLRSLKRGCKNSKVYIYM